MDALCKNHSGPLPPDLGRPFWMAPNPSGLIQWGTEEIQFIPEHWRFEREKGGLEPKK